MENRDEVSIDFIVDLLHSIQDYNTEYGTHAHNNEDLEYGTHWVDKSILRDNILMTIEEFEYDVYETLEKYRKNISRLGARNIREWLKENYKD